MSYTRFCYTCNDRRSYSKVSGSIWKCRSCGTQVHRQKRDEGWKNDPNKLDEHQPRRRMKYED